MSTLPEQLTLVAYAVGLKLFVAAAVVTAGWLRMTRSSEGSIRPPQFVVDGGLIALVSLLERSGSAIALTLSVDSLVVHTDLSGVGGQLTCISLLHPQSASVTLYVVAVD